MRTVVFSSLFCAAFVSSSAEAGSFRDNYHYTTAVNISLTHPVRVDTSDQSEGTLKVAQRGRDIWFTWTEDGNVCKISGFIDGYTIRFNGGQSCRMVDEDSDAQYKLSLVAGSGTVDDDGELDLQIQWKIRGTQAGHPVSGAAAQRTSAIPY